MRTDLKTGIILGTTLVAGALMLISVFSSNIEESRRQKISLDSNAETSTELTNLQTITPTSPARSKSESQTSKKLSLPEEDEAIPESKPFRQEVQPRIHIVAEGETLTSISIEYYGSANMLQEILTANRGIIKDANKLSPGMRLVIPK
jgi:nucleoid-associated protein YgaU